MQNQRYLPEEMQSALHDLTRKEGLPPNELSREVVKECLLCRPLAVARCDCAGPLERFVRPGLPAWIGSERERGGPSRCARSSPGDLTR
jgi:hypothetical protein